MRLAYDPSALRRVTDPKEFGRVAVLLGGDSSEREISLLSGSAVLAALQGRGVDAHAFDPRDRHLASTIDFDRVWIALHGPGGEDGTVQGALEYLGVPYTGSGVMGSAIGMDKLRTKRLAHAIGVATADYVVLRGPQDFEIAIERLGLPLIVKPATQGSSVGMTKVERESDLPAAYQAAATLESSVFAEPWITGKEFTVAVLQGRALPSIRIETPKTFYDYEAKYGEGGSRHVVPAPIPDRIAEAAMRMAERAHAALGCRGVTRSDFRYDDVNDVLVLLEVNTQPGMTPTSLVPEQAAYLGVSYDDLVLWITEDASCRR